MKVVEGGAAGVGGDGGGSASGSGSASASGSGSGSPWTRLPTQHETQVRPGNSRLLYVRAGMCSRSRAFPGTGS